MSVQNAMPSDVLISLPEGLPVPIADGACDHVEGLALPDQNLLSTNGEFVNPSRASGWAVIFCYPMTGRPGKSIPDGWIQIPGAAGCTPQACSFRDNFSQLSAKHVRVYGLSTQSHEDQVEASGRLHLPFHLLSDLEFKFSGALQLPILEVAGMRLTKRVTLIAKDGVIQKCFYPVFPPDKNVEEVIQWFSARET